MVSYQRRRNNQQKKGVFSVSHTAVFCLFNCVSTAVPVESSGSAGDRVLYLLDKIALYHCAFTHAASVAV